MKIAVTFQNGEIFQHFGHSEYFKIVEVENKEIINEEIVSTNGSGHGALADFLKNNNINVLICGGIGGGAINAVTSYGISIYPGISGDADKAINELINGTLKKREDATCKHHEGEHHCK
ncbi:MAG: dinitrogenase iron-molybdenum cofactor biosynthesis protein [Clostridiales bacterium]|nr:dinitrogenase iron-molybdenum cofactor biosynthesis protein [Clostridiales bacterium]